ncbi:MAG: flagellar biosynthetic protein FliO [Planctomycetes bacterium]|nr:flagellar biosynthetic protein FliO [Planctomycetota bacterium]
MFKRGDPVSGHPPIIYLINLDRTGACRLLAVLLLCFSLVSVRAIMAAEESKAPYIKPVVGPEIDGEPKVAPSQNKSLEEYGKGFVFGEDAKGANKNTGTAKKAPETMVPGGFGYYILMYLFLLGGALWLALHFVKKYVPGGKQLFASPGMEILGRTHLDPRNYMALVRVGGRVLVVGVGPDGVRTLSEIDDDAELVRVLEENKPKSEAGASLFQRLFSAHVMKADDRADAARASNAAEDVKTSISELRDRVRNLRDAE